METSFQRTTQSPTVDRCPKRAAEPDICFAFSGPEDAGVTVLVESGTHASRVAFAIGSLGTFVFILFCASKSAAGAASQYSCLHNLDLHKKRCFLGIAWFADALKAGPLSWRLSAWFSRHGLSAPIAEWSLKGQSCKAIPGGFD